MATEDRSPEKIVRDRMMAVILRASIARQIRDLRVARNLTQKELAAGLKTSQSNVSGWEDPQGEWMTINTLNSIASFFDVGLLVTLTTWSKFLEVYCAGKLPTPMSFSQEQPT